MCVMMRLQKFCANVGHNLCRCLQLSSPHSKTLQGTNSHFISLDSLQRLISTVNKFALICDAVLTFCCSIMCTVVGRDQSCLPVKYHAQWVVTRAAFTRVILCTVDHDQGYLPVYCSQWIANLIGVLTWVILCTVGRDRGCLCNSFLATNINSKSEFTFGKWNMSKSCLIIGDRQQIHGEILVK